MPSRKLVHFPIPPKAVFLAGQRPEPRFGAEELEAARREGYHRGAEEAARTFERQMLEQRTELVHLQTATFEALLQQHAALLEQFRGMVPELVMEALARVLTGVTPDRAMIVSVIDDLLRELSPTGEAIEVQLHPSDLALVTGYEENLREKFPAIGFRTNAELQPGDGVVRSRFGVIDGRLGTKFRAVEAMFE